VPIGLAPRGPAESDIQFLNQHLRAEDLVLQVLFRHPANLSLLEQITACRKGLGLPASFEGDPGPLLAEAKSKGIQVVAYDDPVKDMRQKVFYPVFPPDRNADEVLAWLRDHT